VGFLNLLRKFLLIIKIKTLIFLIAFIRIKNPISLGICLILLVCLYRVYLTSLFKNSWFSILFLLLVLGGLLVIFIYIARLSSNEDFSFNKNLFILIIIAILLFPSTKKSINLFKDKYLRTMYIIENLTRIAFVLTYIIVVLLIVVNLLKKVNSPLRSNF